MSDGKLTAILASGSTGGISKAVIRDRRRYRMAIEAFLEDDSRVASKLQNDKKAKYRSNGGLKEIKRVFVDADIKHYVTPDISPTSRPL